MGIPLGMRDVARRLEVSRQRVHALIRSERLPARRVGREWLVDSDDVERLASRRSGRPLSAANAWGLLALLSGFDASWVIPPVRSRLRKVASSGQRAAELLAHSEPRFVRYPLRVLKADQDRLSLDGRLVRSGLSALPSGIDVIAGDEPLDVYVDANLAKAMRRKLSPIEDSPKPNLILRIPSNPWVLSLQRSVPGPVAAADLLAHDDPRVRRAAWQFLEDLAR